MYLCQLCGDLFAQDATELRVLFNTYAADAYVSCRRHGGMHSYSKRDGSDLWLGLERYIPRAFVHGASLSALVRDSEDMRRPS